MQQQRSKRWFKIVGDGKMNKKLLIIYEALLKHYGPQGWWPLTSLAEEGKDGGYHPGDYEHPKRNLMHMRS